MSQFTSRLLAVGMATAVLAVCGAGDVTAADDSPAGPISDAADILPAAAESELDHALRSYWTETGNALVVASVTSLNGMPIEKMSLETARRWDIGDTKTMRGMLIMVAPNERRVRIEVSCGLESIVSDERAADVIQSEMLPLFRQGSMADGTVAGARALMKLTREHAGELDRNDPPAACLKEAA